MENLSKEVLITIIKDLNKQLDEKNELCKNFVDENAIEQGKVITKLKDDLRFSNNNTEHYKTKYEHMSERHKRVSETYGLLKAERDELQKRLDDDTSSVSSDEVKPKVKSVKAKVDQFNMTTKQRCNVINFIQKFCIWTSEPVPYEGDDGSSFVTLAPASSTDIHQNLRAWAIQEGIATKGKDRGIPDKVSFVKFMTSEQKRRYPQQLFKPQEKWEYPYPYWGTHSSPRFNIRLKRTFTS